MPLVNCLVNGQPSSAINVEDRGLHYGDGLFETMLCCQGEIKLWAKHYARLAHGCRRLSLNLCSEQDLVNDIKKLTQNLSASCYLIKLMVTRGAAGRGIEFDESVPVTRVLLAYDYVKPSVEHKKSLKICKTPLLMNKMLGGLKHLNRLIYILAGQELTEKDDEGLMLNDQNEIIEGITHNVFFVKNHQLITAPIDFCGVAGVMRLQVLETAKIFNIDVQLRAISLAEIDNMDECFITNAVLGIQSVAHINDVTFTQDTITMQLKRGIEFNA